MGYRILYHHRTQALDGQRVHIRAIQQALRELGHEVIEVAPLPAVESAGAPALRTWRRRIFESIKRVAPTGLYEGVELAYNLPGYREICVAIRKSRPDFIYERYSLNTIAGALAAKKFDLPFMLEVNAPLADEKRALGQLLFYGGSRRIEQFVLSRAARVLPVTDVLGDILRISANLEAERVVVVHNGADIKAIASGAHDRNRIRMKFGWRSEDVVVGIVGFFREWHGLDLLAKALVISGFSRPPRLLIVGDGPGVADLKLVCDETGIEAVFTRTVPHDSVPSYLAAIDLVVIPRAVEYASPLKLFEYMTAGKAIVAPRQPNLLEIITEDQDALCFRREDVRDLARVMDRLITDSSLRRELGSAARKTIERRELTWNGNAKRIIDAFKTLRRN